MTATRLRVILALSGGVFAVAVTAYLFIWAGMQSPLLPLGLALWVFVVLALRWLLLVARDEIAAHFLRRKVEDAPVAD